MILSEVLAAQSLPCVLSCPYKNTRFQNKGDLTICTFHVTVNVVWINLNSTLNEICLFGYRAGWAAVRLTP